jgi:hypothetical protein
VQAGNDGEVLLRVADKLCAELAIAGSWEIPEGHSTLGEAGMMAGILSADDESLVKRLSEALAKIAAALGVGLEDPPTRAVWIALDGAEMVVRGELVSGKVGQLPRLMPSLVFLVALPIVDQDRALELSRRTVELIEAEQGL